MVKFSKQVSANSMNAIGAVLKAADFKTTN